MAAPYSNQEDICQSLLGNTTQPSGILYQVIDVAWNGRSHPCAPCICLLVLVLISLYLTGWRRRAFTQSKQQGTHMLLKEFASVYLAVVTLISATGDKTDIIHISKTHHGGQFRHLFDVGIFVMVATSTMLERMHGSFRWSLTVSASWCLILASATSTLYSYTWTDVFRLNLNVEVYIDLARFLGALFVFALSCSPRTSAEGETPKPEPELQDVNPEDNASWWSNVTVAWAFPLLWTGFRRNLKETDVPPLAFQDKCSNVFPRLERAWRQEELRCRLANEKQDSWNQRQQVDGHTRGDPLIKSKTEPGGKHIPETYSLIKALLRAFGLKFFFFQLMLTVLEMQDFAVPMLTASLMNYKQNRKNESSSNAIFILVCIFLFKCTSEIAKHRIWSSAHRINRHMNISTKMIIFKKAMTIRNECIKDKTNGELVNLLALHCEEIFNIVPFTYNLLMAPPKIGLALYLLYSYLGWSMIVGVVILLLLIPLNYIIGRRLETLYAATNETRDKRIKLLNEIINGIRVLKLYAWEKSFIDKVNAIRSEEMNIRTSESMINASMSGLFRAIPFLVKVGAFGIFFLGGGHLDATRAFVTISLFNILNTPINAAALQIPRHMEALMSLRRLNEFLSGEDISPDVIRKMSKGTAAVTIKNGSFSWERLSPEATLANINVTIPKGGLVAVVGVVGSGKSSLLSSMLGEMEKLEGQVEIQGRMAYVPQEAWILNKSLQDNILFGTKFDKDWYRQVVHGCCLHSDIKLMVAGDKTEIGEKGITLSGGQKQRVSLARAVFNDADIYLLDDPLSAVDAHVGKNIFEGIIGHQGMLRDKTRVLVTHGIQWLPLVDSIIVMKDGQVSETGTYEELLSRDGAFAQFLADVCSHVSNDEGKEITELKQNIFKRLNSRPGDQEGGVGQVIETIQSVAQGDNVISDSNHDEDNDDDDDDNDDDDDGDNDDDVDDGLTLCHDRNDAASMGKIIDEEEMEQGAVKKHVYWDYLKALGIKSFIVFTLLYLVTMVADKYKTFIIKAWTDDSSLNNAPLPQTAEYYEASVRHFYSFVISGLIEIISTFFFIMLTLKGAFHAADRIHNKLLHTVVKCPMSFFDTTPCGRVVNRFASDMSRVEHLAYYVRECIQRFLTILSSIVLIVVKVPVILLCLIPVLGLYGFIQRIHMASMRQIRRYRSKHRSPICLHLSESLRGLASIRAYHCQDRFIQTMGDRIEEWAKFDAVEKAVTTWFRIRLTCLFVFIQAFVALIVVLNSSMSAGMAGVVLFYTNEFCDHWGSLLRLITCLEINLVSLERVLNYANKSTEAPWEITETKPASDWPSNGHVVFNDLKARYRDGLDLVLKGVNIDISHGEKIGIVGRTGAGKSSLTVALFRLIEAAGGHIEIDNVNTVNLGLHDLRRKITILPQDPVIFSGTLRMNLDPFDKCSTKELWVALQHAHLKSFVESLPEQLDYQCGEGGKNLSVGQRQLLCLARTLLRRTKILVLDEATAAVDMETDELIQETIRVEFKECTVLTIAHRLNTIIDYDRILVLDQGTVKEFDSPKNLLANKDSVFFSMVKDAKLLN